MSNLNIFNNKDSKEHLLFDSFESEYEEIIKKSPIQWREIIQSYFKNMSDMQKKTFMIAKNHLGTSFNIFKSNGFVDFEKQLQSQRQT
jgi:hypothetical protein